MDIFVFSSENLTNIWAGVGARTWAVAPKQAKSAQIQGKAKKLAVGSLGLFYCVESKCLTTPFMVTSKPQVGEIVSHIWSGQWGLPFGIVPLGSPHKTLRVSSLASKLPSLSSGQGWASLFHVAPATVFAASKLTPEDWAAIVGELL